MTHPQRRDRQKQVVAALRHPQATIVGVARRFALSAAYVEHIARKAGLNVPFEMQILNAIQQQKRRNEQMVAMVKKGATLREVGAHFGVTRERVRQILREAGILTLSIREEAMQKAIEAVKKGSDIRKTAQKYRVPFGTLRTILAQSGLTAEKAAQHPSRAVQMLGYLFQGETDQQVAERFGCTLQMVRNLASTARRCGVPVPNAYERRPRRSSS